MCFLHTTIKRVSAAKDGVIPKASQGFWVRVESWVIQSSEWLASKGK